MERTEERCVEKEIENLFFHSHFPTTLQCVTQNYRDDHSPTNIDANTWFLLVHSNGTECSAIKWFVSHGGSRYRFVFFLLSLLLLFLSKTHTLSAGNFHHYDWYFRSVLLLFQVDFPYRAREIFLTTTHGILHKHSNNFSYWLSNL